MTEEQAFIEWKAEQYKHQSTEEELEFVEHLHYFPKYFKKTFLDGYHECQKEHEWHYDGVPDITHKSCLVNVDYLPNIMLCFWNGEVWIEPRTLERLKKVKAWKYVDFPKEIE